MKYLQNVYTNQAGNLEFIGWMKYNKSVGGIRMILNCAASKNVYTYETTRTDFIFLSKPKISVKHTSV